MMNNIYPGMENLSLCDLMKVTAYGRPLWRWGFWNLAARVLSNEGYQFMKDAGGYEANVANANAVTQLPSTEYTDTTQFKTLRDGYDELPKTLAREFNETMPGAVAKGDRLKMNHRLCALEIGTGEYPYTLTFEPTATKDAKTRAIGGAEKIVVRAKKVVLAMPRRSLELITSNLFRDSWLDTNISSVLIQSAFKLLLAYETPWWRALGLVAGRSVTDLPIRQTFYFGTEAEQEFGQPFMNSLLMASYNDMGTVPFWKGLEEGTRYEGYRPRCLEPGVTNVIPATEFDATNEMVSTANRQIAAMHAMPDLPMPYSAVYHTWNEDPYGGGWHEWKANYRLDEIMCKMRKPVADQDIFIVGEAYSFFQGWVEGALDTAESMLEDFFGLKRPDWVKDPNFQLMPNPCPGCGDITGCIDVQQAQQVLDAATPSCLNPPAVG
jgi:monoamine oxidase